MPGHECYHCKQWVDEGEAHDCWTTTEAALTRDLSDDLHEAWERLRETAAAFGDQRIYASHRSIMFARKACYFFVRPKRSALEIVFFLGRGIKARQIRRADTASRRKIAHVVNVKHRDEVEPPLTDWLLEAYETSDALSGAAPLVVVPKRRAAQKRPKKKHPAVRRREKSAKTQKVRRR